MNRRREADEVPLEKKRYRMQCKYCKEFGHNKRGCPVNPLNANKTTRHYKDYKVGHIMHWTVHWAVGLLLAICRHMKK